LADRIKPDFLTDRLGANLDGVLAEYAVFNEEAVVTLRAAAIRSPADTHNARGEMRASRPCEYGATGTGKNQGIWGGFRAGPAFQNLRPLERSIPLRPSQHGLSGSTTT